MRLRLRVVACAVLAGGGFAGGLLTNGSDHAARRTPVPVVLDTPTNPIAGRAGREEAVRFATRASVSLVRPEFLREPERQAPVIAGLALAERRRQFTAKAVQSYAFLAGKLGLGRDATPVAMRTIPLGWRVEAFGRDEADVSLWRLVVIATPASPRSQGMATTLRMRLRFRGGRWWIDRLLGDRPGPTPDIASVPTAPPEFVAQVESLRPYRSFAP